MPKWNASVGLQLTIDYEWDNNRRFSDAGIFDTRDLRHNREKAGWYIVYNKGAAYRMQYVWFWNPHGETTASV